MNIDLEQHRREYHLDGITIIRGLVPDELVEDWVFVSLALARDPRAVVLDRPATEAHGEVLDAGGAYVHTILDGHLVAEELPSLMGWYAGALPLIALVTFGDAILSPYPRSAVNVKLYPGPGGQQGWHYDSNTLTGLLMLTTERNEGALLIRDLHGDERTIQPEAGALVVMQGRRVEHAVQPMETAGRTRITVPLNYYTETDQDRPAGMDELVYGPSPR